MMAWKARMDAVPSVRKALKEEAAIVSQHRRQLAAGSAEPSEALAPKKAA